MPKGKRKQRRVGSQEAKKIAKMIKIISKYKAFLSQKKERETRFNDRLMDHLRQEGLHVRNSQIPSPRFFDETFRPEFYYGTASNPILAVECKRLTEGSAKARWKEGLSQALIYSSKYKIVILVFFDFTNQAKYATRWGRGQSDETRFITKLREKKIHIVFIKAQADA